MHCYKRILPPVLWTSICPCAVVIQYSAIEKLFCTLNTALAVPLHQNINTAYPCVVEAVTDTTIMVAAGRTSSRPTLVTSRSFCNNCGKYGCMTIYTSTLYSISLVQPHLHRKIGESLVYTSYPIRFRNYILNLNGRAVQRIIEFRVQVRSACLHCTIKLNQLQEYQLHVVSSFLFY